MKFSSLIRISVISVILAATGAPRVEEATAQQEGPPLVMVTEQQVRPGLRQQYEQNRRNLNANYVREGRPFPFTVMTADDGTYFYLTHGLRGMAGRDEWQQAANAAALPPPPEQPVPTPAPAILSANQWYIFEQTAGSYVPENPRLSPEDVGFVHWEVYYGAGSPARWGIPQDEWASAGLLGNAAHFGQLGELYRESGIRDGFTVYTSFATSHPGGAVTIVETRARDAADYYSRLVETKRRLGAEGLVREAVRRAGARKIESLDFEVRPDLSYAGPGN